MTRTIRRFFIPALIGGVLFTGCTVNRDIMFKTPNDHVFDTIIDATRNVRLQPNDVLEFRLFANDGFKMIDLVSEGGARGSAIMNRNIFSYYVEFDGVVKLPLIGRVPISGLSMREAEAMLEERYSEFYNSPYVQVTVTNRRVVVSPVAVAMPKW